MLRNALISLGLMLSLTSCAGTQWMTRTEYVREQVPVSYVQPTPIPGPPPLISQCPNYVETLKHQIMSCNSDKRDVIEWSAQPSPDTDSGQAEEE